MNNLRKIAAGSLAAVLAFSMAACGSSNASSDGTGESTGKAVPLTALRLPGRAGPLRHMHVTPTGLEGGAP